jgi:hypothetical protein
MIKKENEVELVSVPCSKCGKPVEITRYKKALVGRGKADPILCLECYIESHPDLFK